MPKTPFELSMPKRRTTSVVFASPHSGRDYPETFLSRSVLDERAIRSSEDAYVDLLFSHAAQAGAPLLAGHAPRAFVDYNRGCEELDPALISEVVKAGHNPRVASGLGVIPRVVANGRQIYRGKIPLAEATSRLLRYWHPYHQQLQTLLNQSKAMFGRAILIDCHSMPHEAIESLCRNQQRVPEIVLGDRFGASAGSGIVDRIEAAFAGAGLSVVRNKPFAGAYTAQHYGRPSRQQHVIQVEIDRALYLDERAVRPNGNFDTMRSTLRQVIDEIADIGRQEIPLAAE